MQFKRAVQRYGRTPEPVTPYQRAAQAWDERIGAARVQARNWRIMAFGGLLLSCGLASGLVWQSVQSRVTPYVVEVDRLGEARSVAPATENYDPTDPQIAWALGRFIANVRGISLDPVLMRANWLAAYDFAGERGALFLNEFARSSDPFAQVGARSISVEITSVVRASPRSWQVKWKERAYERGSLAASSRWTAMLTVKVKRPRSADVLRKNPLGLYVEAIDWSREYEREERSRDSAITPLQPPDEPVPGIASVPAISEGAQP
ncbi:conjugal transfer protein TrbF [Sphingopyxis sp. PAMC25046]|uniref:conjugal transfer protein TrbF n=1 Tax=Sphingopyxis sp. PAMC25046 TaxID=2565556 RepID=UPI00109E3466|nr:conjugal transfer protein TrbF [Sphingopyxis sp. PAMC25046]QCB55765.1 conjugal transfer protein TrbF [Sphingopyxis sp. PAMC25046]